MAETPLRLGAKPSTPRRKYEPPWCLGQATRGLPFMVHLNGFAIVALK
jgi:hypothetical protein